MELVAAKLASLAAAPKLFPTALVSPETKLLVFAATVPLVFAAICRGDYPTSLFFDGLSL